MKPTILFILHLPPPVHGAAMIGKYIRESQLINDTFDCHYINLALAKDLADIGKGGRQKLIRYIKLLKTIFREVRRLRPSLVYVTPNAKGGAFYKEFVIVMLLKLMRQKIVVHYHNKGVATRQDRPVDNFLYRRFFKNLKVILLAESLYEDVRKYVDRKDVFICPNGIPEQTTEPEAKRNNRIPHLLFLSNLLESKGVLVLLDACRILKDKGYSFICEFVGGETGEIDARRFEKEVQARRLNELVFYKGPKSGKEKQMYFEQADVFVFPTYYPNETFGLVNVEAMQYKLPVVSTDEGGIPDVIKDGVNGLLCQKKDPVSLTQALEQLLSDPQLREKMGEKGHQLFKEKFTLQTFERNFINIVNKCERGGVKCNFIFYYGPQYGEKKKQFLQKADVFVFPTYYPNECFPLVLLEAMEAGTACIGTDEGGIRDIIDEGITGFIVEKKNPHALADKMEILLNDPALRRGMGEKGKNKFLKNFTLRQFEERMKNSLVELIWKDFINGKVAHIAEL